MFETINVINRSGEYYFFTCIKLVVHVLACALAMACIKWRETEFPNSEIAETSDYQTNAAESPWTNGTMVPSAH